MRSYGDYIMGVSKISDKHYKRDIIIRTKKSDDYLPLPARAYEYVDLNSNLIDTSALDEEDRDLVVRGFQEFVRAGNSLPRHKIETLIYSFIFKPISYGGKTIDIGLSGRLKQSSFLYKQPINLDYDYDYITIRIEFKADAEVVHLDTTHSRNIFTGHDVILDSNNLLTCLKDDLKQIITDTLYLYSLYLQVFPNLTPDEIDKINDLNHKMKPDDDY